MEKSDADKTKTAGEGPAPGEGATNPEEAARPSVAAVAYPLGFDTKVARYFFYAFALLVLVGSLLLVKPFLTVIFVSFAIFVVSKPIFNRFQRLFRGRRTPAAIAACIAIVLILFVPFVLFAGILASSAYDFYSYVTQAMQSGDLQRFLDLRQSSIMAFVESHVPALHGYELNVGEIAGNVLGTLSQAIYGKTAAVAKGFSSILVGFVLVIFVTYYLFLDGDRFLGELKRLSPMDDRYDQEIIDEFSRTVKLTFKGSLVIALIQGALGSVGFLICGIDSWALWGVVMAVSSLIPAVGTALIWIPAVIVLALQARYGSAVFLLLWGIIPIGLSDNLLRPYLMKGEMNLHPLLIFFSVIGGVAYFGFLGIILGPLVLSLLIYVLRIYRRFISPAKTVRGG
jgi:predicted PurR-regulated permease PerM